MMMKGEEVPWPPEEMADLLDALARAADRYRSSYSETAHLAECGAATIRKLVADQARARPTGGRGMSEVDWKKVADRMRVEAERLQEMSDAKPHLGLIYTSAPAILVLRGIAQAIEEALK